MCSWRGGRGGRDVVRGKKRVLPVPFFPFRFSNCKNLSRAHGRICIEPAFGIVCLSVRLSFTHNVNTKREEMRRGEEIS